MVIWRHKCQTRCHSSGKPFYALHERIIRYGPNLSPDTHQDMTALFITIHWFLTFRLLFFQSVGCSSLRYCNPTLRTAPDSNGEIGNLATGRAPLLASNYKFRGEFRVHLRPKSGNLQPV